FFCSHVIHLISSTKHSHFGKIYVCSVDVQGLLFLHSLPHMVLDWLSPPQLSDKKWICWAVLGTPLGVNQSFRGNWTPQRRPKRGGGCAPVISYDRWLMTRLLVTPMIPTGKLDQRSGERPGEEPGCLAVTSAWWVAYNACLLTTRTCWADSLRVLSGLPPPLLFDWECSWTAEEPCWWRLAFRQSLDTIEVGGLGDPAPM
ncbi:hypothetical protein DL96DRAFT_1763792, partial [Flagelloscypha sp. PMI_526]